MKIKISKLGITFSYYGDEITWLWPWSGWKDKYVSRVYGHGFPSLRDYWQFVGVWNEACRKEKVIGYTEKEVLMNWAKHEFRHNVVILLRNINVEMKSTAFWKSVDVFSRKQLLKDICVLFFHDERQALKVLYAIPPEFAEAHLVSRGFVVENNTEQKPENNRGDYPGPN